MGLDEVLEVLHSLGRLAEEVFGKAVSLGVVSAAVSVLYTLLKIRAVNKRLRRRWPGLFAEERLNQRYISNQETIMENQRRIMGALGVEPAWPPDPQKNAVTLRTSSDSASSRRTSSIFSWAGRSRAHAAAARAQSFTINSNIRRKNKMLEKWIKPDSLTVIAGVLITSADKFLGLDIDPTNILGAVVLLVGYIKSHELVTVTRDANGLPSGFRLNSRKTIFTAVGFAIMVANVAFGWNLSIETILSVVAGITGYNYLEASKDVKSAEAEAADAKQTH